MNTQTPDSKENWKEKLDYIYQHLDENDDYYQILDAKGKDAILELISSLLDEKDKEIEKLKKINLNICNENN